MAEDSVDRLRANDNGSDGLALVLYLDLPQEEVRKWKDRTTVLAVATPLAREFARILSEADGTSVAALEDEAARATNLFVNAGPDLQAFAAGLVEALVSLQGKDVTGYNLCATTTIEQAQRRMSHELSEDTSNREVELLVEACERFLAQTRDMNQH
jgi:hypothetical protein